MAEFLALYGLKGKGEKGKRDKRALPLSSQVKKGLAMAFEKFDRYQLAKWAGTDNAITLRDVMFLTHPKAKERLQEAYKGIADKNLSAKDVGTWESRLSAGQDKKATFAEMLKEGKLGYLALLRNLRNMVESGVDLDLIREALLARKGAEKVLPFRYVAAARACPQLEPFIDQALTAAVAEMEPLSGETIVLVDVSGSMDSKLSAKSDMTQMDAAATLASIIPGNVRIFTFSNHHVEVPPRKGMAGVEKIIGSQSHGGTELGEAVRRANRLPHDRLIVITDEQSHDPVPDPVAKRAYLINTASNRNGVGYGAWVHIDGFSEAVLTFIRELERQD